MLGCHQQQNLGQRARGKAVRAGVLMGGLALGWALLSAELGVSKSLGWLVAIPAAFSAYLLISGSLGICIYYGLKGQRDADHGHEAVLDRERRSELRLRALLVVSVSVLVASGFAVAVATSG